MENENKTNKKGEGETLSETLFRMGCENMRRQEAECLEPEWSRNPTPEMLANFADADRRGVAGC